MDHILRRGVLGAVIGSTLGAPFRGQTVFRRLGFYEPIPVRMSASETLDAWIVAAKHVGAERSAELLSYSYRTHWHSMTHECAFGRYNLEIGHTAPLSGSFRNPLGEGSEALGRAVVYGILFHGDSATAVRHAVADAGIDHRGEGVWAAAAVARMASVAEPGVGPQPLLRAGLELLPEASLARRSVAQVVRSLSSGKTPAEVHAELPGLLGAGDPLHAGLSFGWIALALLAGGGRFGPTVATAAGCGGAAAATATVAGTLAGLANPDGQDEWLGPLGGAFVASTVLKGIDLPESMEEFASLIVDESKAAVGLAAAVPPAAPAVGPARAAEESSATEPGEPGEPVGSAGTDGEPVEAAAPAPTASAASAPAGPAIPSWTGGLPYPPEDAMQIDVGGLRVAVRYLDPPVRRSGKANSVVVSFATDAPTPIAVEPELVLPEGWTSASRLTSCRVASDAPVEFPAVLQGPARDAGRAALELRANGAELGIVLLPVQPWMVCGPFVNHEGQGFEKAYRCEDVLQRGEVFNGRSDLPVRWTECGFPGIVFDLEPHFRTGPGVVYLSARVTWPAGRRRVVFGASPGGAVLINRQPVVRYHHTHCVAPRAVKPYVAEFDATGEDAILVKVLRNREPLDPVTLYFLEPDGRLTEPEGFVPMP